MNNLANIFNYQEKQIRTITIDNEPWFVAKDICQILELDNVSKALSDAEIDDDEKLTSLLVMSGQKRQYIFISESGLYSLILNSRKPEAKPFKKWITKEVLPSIRKTGFYQHYKNKQLEELKALLIREVPMLWQKTFPDIFFERVCDLKGWQYNGAGSTPSCFAKIIRDYIYCIVPSEIMQIVDNINNNKKLHQWFTEEPGRKYIEAQITRVVTILQISNNWNEFEKLFNKCQYGQSLLDVFNNPQE